MAKHALENNLDLNSFWSSVISKNGSIAFWCCPREKTIHCLADLSGSVSRGRVDLKTIDQGFIVSPFLNPEGNETLFLKRDVYAEYKDGQWRNQFGIENIINHDIQNPKSYNYHLNERPDTEISGEKAHFIQMVEDALVSINEGEFDKVVSARTYDEPLPDHFDIIQYFLNLVETYQDAFVSLVSIPGRGTWIGATPELLIEYSEDHFRTVSVAGTQPFSIDKELSDAGWNQKEIEEQAMVSRYIIDQFKTIRLRSANRESGEYDPFKN